MDSFFASNPIQLISVEVFENDKKVFGIGQTSIKNQKQSSVNQSNKEATSNKLKGCTQENENEPNIKF